ncbi:signal peptide peptidase SppA [Erythrobacter crassostreae]|uniref:Signal peptide peptidase SppA n=1 Tax=Erythrobacter crassostreae TaxID=2828328 RepID=A0A9X1JP82_9SPHN|nr:signal peptide peptidase SppA [Erythrobacter crassostrea]MBV7259162.1 signal peptide peptidase SppA [Erythrobacter crassostrea]
MSFVGKVWKVLVGVKDGLVLIFMLLFFLALFSLLSATPNPGQVREGALYIDLSGYVVEERSEVDPIATLLSGQAPPIEHQARDLVSALDAAAGDDRIKAVVMDLTTFVGGGQVHMQEIGEAMDRVRKTEKPVFTYALAYGDDHMHLAAHASEVWADPLGGAMIAGPGGSNLYYADLLDRLNINARIYRVGTFKAAVEPYSRSSMSEEARENIGALYGALWEEWQANVKKARPAIELDRVTKDTVAWVEESGGDLAKAALAAGLVDKLGDRVEFGTRVAEVAGEDEWSKLPGAYAKSDLSPFLADTAPSRNGKAIGVVTIAGVIVDGEAGPGTAGGTRIAKLLDKALENDLAGLVVRVNSPGGSVLASEEILRAIDRHRAKDIPVAVSFANVAASGGYWVATSSDRIFAQPETVTGSIGVFAVLPTFEDAASEIGVNADGFRTTPLSGQPDLVAGLSPEVDAILQASVTDTYTDFLDRVSKARGKTNAEVNTIAQGRVWDGGSARQLGLVDQFGGLDDALAWVAGEAELEDDGWHPVFLGQQAANYNSLIRQLVSADAAPAARSADLFARAAINRELMLTRIAVDVERLTDARGIQAYCLECPSDIRPVSGKSASSMIEVFRALVAQ